MIVWKHKMESNNIAYQKSKFRVVWKLRPGGEHYHRIVDGAAWRLVVQMDKSNRDGDIETIMRLSADATENTNAVIERLLQTNTLPDVGH